MSISVDGVSLGGALPASVIRAQDALAAARAAQAPAKTSIAASVYASQSTRPQGNAGSVDVSQMAQRAGAAVALLRQNEPNNPLLPLADGIHAMVRAAQGDIFSVMSGVSELRNAYNFALDSGEKLLNTPILAAID